MSSPRRFPRLNHDGAEPPGDGGGRALQRLGDTGGQRLVADDVQLGGDHDLLAPGLAPALVLAWKLSTQCKLASDWLTLTSLRLRDAAKHQPRHALAQSALPGLAAGQLVTVPVPGRDLRLGYELCDLNTGL